MELFERIKFMRVFKGWTQEETAAKLHMAVNGYAKIERGETDIPYSRIQQIANTFGIKVSDLIDLNEKNVFNVIAGQDAHANNLSHSSTINIYSYEATKLQHENEKLQLINEKLQLLVTQGNQELCQKNHEIELLQQQINDLRAVIGLLKVV
jgi:transcriptional regulator with XRE-family HTH domain